MSLGLTGPNGFLSETNLTVPAGLSRNSVFAALCAILFAICLMHGPAHAQAAPDIQGAPGEPEVSLEYFREQLSPYGAWLSHPKWGEVWRPDAGPDFRPYFDGYWEYTSDHGSLWISNEPFGDIVYHYGRWIFDRDEGWLWVPGYVWGPSWVVWRANQDYIGWLPMPPGYIDYLQLFTSPYLYPKDTWYGYQTFYGPTFISEHYFTLWIFVLNEDFSGRDGHHHVKDIGKLRELYYRSADCTRYTVDRNRVIDRSIDRGWWRRHAGRADDARPAREHLRRNVPITSVSRGRTISARHAERAAAPRERAGADAIGADQVRVRRSTAGPVPRAARPDGRRDAPIPRTAGRSSARALSNSPPLAAESRAGSPSPVPAPRPPGIDTRSYTDDRSGVSVRRGGSLSGMRPGDGGVTLAPRAGTIARPSPSRQSESGDRTSGVTTPRGLSPRANGGLNSGRGSTGLGGSTPSLLQRR